MWPDGWQEDLVLLCCVGLKLHRSEEKLQFVLNREYFDRIFKRVETRFFTLKLTRVFYSKSFNVFSLTNVAECI